MRRPPDIEQCELCQRQLHLTFHHLIPRKLHRRNHFRLHYAREALAKGIWLCRSCHSAVHRLHDEMTLGARLNTLQALRNDTAIARHVRWARRQRRKLAE